MRPSPMTGSSLSSLADASRRASRSCGAATALVGALVLAGWAFHAGLLTRLLPGFAPMAPNTAFAFVLVGIAIWLLSGRDAPDGSRAAATGAGGVVVCLGTLTLIQYLTHRSLGIDELLFADPRGAVETVAPGRMAPATTVNFICLGIAISLMAARRAPRTAQALCLVACGLSLVAVAGHLYGIRALYGVGPYTGIAPHTVLTFLLANVGLLASDPDHGVTALWTSDAVGGRMVRRVLPFAIGIPVVLGWLERKGWRAGLYESEFGVALLIVASIVLITLVIGWEGVALDRIDRERSQATRQAGKAHETLRKLSRAVEQSPAAVVITDTKGDIEYVNPKFTQVTGFSSDEVLGTNPRILKSGELPPEVYRELWETITAGREWRGVFHNRKKNGESFWDLASISPIFDERRRITNFVSVNEDITEQKRTEEALRFQNLLLATLSEVAPDGILVVDANARIVRYNRQFTQIMGIREEQAVEGDDAPVLEAVMKQAADPAAFLARVRYLYAHPDETAQEEVAFKDGRTIERYSAPMASPDGHHYGRVWYFRDVTESRALAEQLRQTQKMEAVGRLAGGIAHDFNNLLTVITGYVELAAGRLKTGEAARMDLSEIEKAAERATVLTRQLLAFSRKQILQPRVIDLNRVVSETDKMLRRVIGEHIALVTLPTEPLCSVKADTGQIEQVLLNLAVNARDAMPKGGTLTIETCEVDLDETYSAFHFDVPAGRYVLLAVSDTGVGMDAKTVTRVFEPFFTTKEVGKGTGLGLSTVWGIVKQSGGHVTVYSEPGMGTTFKIYLPCVQDAPDDPGTPPRERETGGTETILVVEDEEAVRRLACRLLEAKGYTALSAAGPAEALALCEKHGQEIDLMLTDVVMPALGGKDLAERAAAFRPRMKVLFMSGYTDDAIVHHGALDPGTSFIQKPFTPRSLAQKVRDVLDAGE
ncbi:MAG TPA: PAS domain S-box protein [Thermoanaerobaculia bacterium]